MKRFILIFCALVFSFLSNTSNSFANALENKLENNFSNEIETINSDYDNKKIDISDSSLEDIFGDEQTFPFVAGLGKNAAH